MLAVNLCFHTIFDRYFRFYYFCLLSCRLRYGYLNSLCRCLFYQLSCHDITHYMIWDWGPLTKYFKASYSAFSDWLLTLFKLLDKILSMMISRHWWLLLHMIRHWFRFAAFPVWYFCNSHIVWNGYHHYTSPKRAYLALRLSIIYDILSTLVAGRYWFRATRSFQHFKNYLVLVTMAPPHFHYMSRYFEVICIYAIPSLAGNRLPSSLLWWRDFSLLKA